jgi:hypothetical protein
MDENRFDLPTDERFLALTVMADIDTRLRVLKFTQAHLAASQVIVEFSAGDAEKLQALEKQLDDFIIADARVDTVLQSVPEIIKAAAKLDALINGHVAQVNKQGQHTAFSNSGMIMKAVSDSNTG